ncbi:MAG: hypothetical protein AAB431_02540 [Patescibacteria group bacterium]
MNSREQEEAEQSIEVDRERPPQQEESLNQEDDLEGADSRTIWEALTRRSESEQSTDFTREIEQIQEVLASARAEYAATGSPEHHRSYVDAKKRYAEVMVAAKKIELVSSGVNETEVQTLLADFLRKEIFETVIIQEETLLQEARVVAFPPEQKGTLSRLYEKWDQLSTVKKVLGTTLLATGIAFGTSAIGQEGEGVEIASVALFFSKTFFLNLGQDIVSGFAGAGVQKVLQSKIERGFSEDLERERSETSLESLQEVSEQYSELLKKKSRKETAAVVTSALTMVATGRAYSVGIDLLSQSSAMKGVTEAVVSTLDTNPDVMGKVGEVETVSKPTKGFLGKVLNVFKRTNQ